MTSDPYAVLGVGRHDSMDDIKKAYRELAAKYHPDKYTGHELADLAQEKMKEINEAYDRIVRERENPQSSSRRWEPTPGANTQSGSGQYSQVRQLISEGRIDEAETMIMGMERNAEWYFLMGSIAYRRGWFDEAQANWRNAVSLDPTNAEYNQAYRFARQDPSNIYRSSGDSMDQDICRCCSALLCADCLCGCCR